MNSIKSYIAWASGELDPIAFLEMEADNNIGTPFGDQLRAASTLAKAGTQLIMGKTYVLHRLRKMELK